MKEQVVLCSGSYMGVKRAIVAFESTLLAEVGAGARARARESARERAGARAPQNGAPLPL